MEIYLLHTPGRELTPTDTDAVAAVADVAATFADILRERGYNVANYAPPAAVQDEPGTDQERAAVPVTVARWHLNSGGAWCFGYALTVTKQ